MRSARSCSTATSRERRAHDLHEGTDRSTPGARYGRHGRVDRGRSSPTARPTSSRSARARCRRARRPARRSPTRCACGSTLEVHADVVGKLLQVAAVVREVDARRGCAVRDLAPVRISGMGASVRLGRAFTRALGRANPGGQTYARRSSAADQLPIYLALNNLKSVIPPGFSVPTYRYRMATNNAVAIGIHRQRRGPRPAHHGIGRVVAAEQVRQTAAERGRHDRQHRSSGNRRRSCVCTRSGGCALVLGRGVEPRLGVPQEQVAAACEARVDEPAPVALDRQYDVDPGAGGVASDLDAAIWE
jgi:hypothetical protein